MLMNIILGIIIWFTIIRINQLLQLKFEKLEALNGEFIYTFFQNYRVKECYINISDIQFVQFGKISIAQNQFHMLSLKLISNNQNIYHLQKKENCILFFKTCKEYNPELYERIITSNRLTLLLGINIQHIIENEIQIYEESRNQK